MHDTRRISPRGARSSGVHLRPDSAALGGLPGLRRYWRPHMKAPLLIVMGVVVLVAGSGLAVMNNACKSSHHGWCAPIFDVRHHVKTTHS